MSGKCMILHGDCIEQMKTLEANSVDAIVTDPPYGWSFMGKAWDNFAIEQRRIEEFNRPPRKDGKSRGRGDPALCAGLYDQTRKGNLNFQLFTEAWAKEAFRVLKPGGHALVFCGPRTYHRMASGVEDAGFEIRDQLQWLFGSGFPKSHNIGKAIDKIKGNAREVVGEADVGPDFTGANFHRDSGERKISQITKGASEWEGFGTALKPANEPIVLARKPLEKGLTVAENVLKWGCGAINVDDSRIESADQAAYAKNWDRNTVPDIRGGNFSNDNGKRIANAKDAPKARWPANVLFDEEAARVLDEQTKDQRASKPSKIGKNSFSKSTIWQKGEGKEFDLSSGYFDDGGNGRNASRFFYVAKASKRERNAGLEGMPAKVSTKQFNEGMEGQIRSDGTVIKPPIEQQNHHPTVKPIKLMEYLIKLITPPRGVVLDPFMGSGSTGVACKRLGFEFIGCEMNEEYVEIARKRIEFGRFRKVSCV